MASSSKLPKSVFCVRYKYKSAVVRIFVNYVADPSEDKSMKLPDVLLAAASDTSKQSSNEQTETSKEAELDELTIKTQIEASFEVCFGQGAPDVYRTQNGKHLVMSVKIFHAHWQVLNKMPLEQPKKVFLSVVCNLIEQSLLRTVAGALAPIKLAPFELNIVEESKPPGKKLTEEKIALELILWFISAPEEEDPQPGPSVYHGEPIKKGDYLMGYTGWCDCLERIVNLRCTAHDQPGSFLLPQYLVNIARCTKLGPHLLTKAVRQVDIHRSLVDRVMECFVKFYKQKGPTLHIFFDEHKFRKHILINVPFHISHAEIFMSYPLEPVRNSFITGIRVFYDMLFLFKRRPMIMGLDKTPEEGEVELPGLDDASVAWALGSMKKNQLNANQTNK